MRRWIIMCEITMEKVRERYPNPITAAASRGVSLDLQCYCVGGALVNYVVGELKRHSFGDAIDIAHALRAANSHLSSKQAYDRARRIILANDDRRFELAWKRLDAALRYGCTTANDPRA